MSRSEVYVNNTERHCDGNTSDNSDGDDTNENCHDSSYSEPDKMVQPQEWIKGCVSFDDYERCQGVKGEKRENIYYASEISCAMTLVGIKIFQSVGMHKKI